MHTGEKHHFLTTESDAYALARRLTIPQHQVSMFSEGPGGEPATHAIRSNDVASVEIKHEPELTLDDARVRGRAGHSGRSPCSTSPCGD